MQEHHTKDLIACLKIELAAAARGVIVSRPVSDFTRYDRVLDWNGKLYRAQIKYVSVPACHSAGAVQLNLRKAPAAVIRKMKSMFCWSTYRKAIACIGLGRKFFTDARLCKSVMCLRKTDRKPAV